MTNFTYEIIKPTNTVVLCNSEKQVGLLDFNGPVMTFEGDADESAKVFFDFIADRFARRMSERREWVGLTDWQIAKVLQQCQDEQTRPPSEDFAFKFAKKIEAKLKEKNA